MPQYLSCLSSCLSGPSIAASVAPSVYIYILVSLTGKEEAIVLPGKLSENIQEMSTSRGVCIYMYLCIYGWNQFKSLESTKIRIKLGFELTNLHVYIHIYMYCTVHGRIKGTASAVSVIQHGLHEAHAILHGT